MWWPRASESAVPQTDTRHSERPWQLENRGRPLKLENFTHVVLRIVLRKGLKDLQNLYPGCLVKVFHCMKSVQLRLGKAAVFSNA